MNQSEHLSNAQVESYGNRTLAAGAEETSALKQARELEQPLALEQAEALETPELDEAEALEQHLAGCASCRARVLDYQRAHLALLLDDTMKTAPTADCPNEDDLRNLAAGLSPEPLAATLIQHASTCDHCGPLLRTFTEDFSDDFTPEEQAALANLQSSSAGWQKKTARKMLETSGAQAAAAPATDGQSSPRKPSAKPTVERKPFFWKWVLVPASAALVAMAVFSIWYTQRDTPEKVEKLLAHAYSEQRPLEMRWPGAEWVKFSPIRGPESSLFSEPEAQQRAAKVIAKKLAAPDHSEWLRANAELELLEGHPDQAVNALAPFENQTQSTALLLDLGIAYFQRGQKPDSRADKEHAIAILKQIISANPSHLEALFNLAIAYTAIGSWDDASATWHKYLSLQPTGSWANEARERLQQIEKMHPHSRRE